MKNFALVILLALHGHGAFAPARALAARHDGLAPDGINRSAEAAPGAQRKPRAAAAKRGRRAPQPKGKRTSAAEAALVPVKELDAAGLKNLLPRGDSQAGGVAAAAASRPLLINFWATWCIPCRREFPDLVKIGADYSGRGIEFALVSADDVSDIKTAVPEFLREMRATAMPAYLLNAEDTVAAIAQVDPAWGGELPATFLFDRQGKLAYRHFGIIVPAELRGEIDKVLSQE